MFPIRRASWIRWAGFLLVWGLLIPFPAPPVRAAGWVGVGAAMREDTRSIVFGNVFSDPVTGHPQQQGRYAFSGHQHFGVFRCRGTREDPSHPWIWGSWQQTTLDEFALWDPTFGDIGGVNCLYAADATSLVLAGTNTGQIWRSIDQGATWSKAAFFVGFDGSALMDLARAPNGTIYACTLGEGVYKSEDLGTSFTRLTALSAGTNHILDLGFDPSDASKFFVCTGRSGIVSGGIYYWNGSGWEDRSAGLPELGNPFYRKYSFSSIAVAPDFSSIWAGDLEGGGVVVSTNQGGTWTRTCNFICEPVMEIRAAPDCSGTNGHVMYGTDFGWYESISSVCMHRFPKGLAVKSIAPDPDWSANLALWLATSDGIRFAAPDAFPQPPADQNQSIFDISFLAPSPTSPSGDQTIYAASRQFGIFLSKDRGATWAQYMAPLSNATSGANIGQPVTALALVPTFSGGTCVAATATIFMATQGGGVHKSDIAGSSWIQINDANLPPSLEVSCLAHTPPLDNSALTYPLFAGFASGPVVFRYNDLTGLWEGTGATGARLAGSKITALAIPPKHDGTSGKAAIFAGTDAGLFMSPDRGTNWFPLNGSGGTTSPWVASGKVTAIAFDPDYSGSGAGTIFASRYGSGVFRSTDGGATWLDMGLANLVSGCSGTPGYAWTFQGAGGSSDPNPTCTYSGQINDIRAWSLTASYNGQTITRTGQVKIKETSACRLKDCSVSAAPSAGKIPLRVEFAASAMPINCASDATYLWDFGPGEGTSTDPCPTHVYRTASTYPWSLSITLPGDGIYTFTGQILAQASATCTWTCSAGATPASGPSPLTVAFQGSAAPYLEVTAMALSPDYTTDHTLVVGTDVPGQQSSGGVYICPNAHQSSPNWFSRNLNLTDRHVGTLAFVKPPSGDKRLLCGTQKQRVVYNDNIYDQNSAWVSSSGYSSITGEIRAVVLSPTPTNLGCLPPGSSGSSGSDVFAGGTQGVFWSNDGGETFRPLNRWLDGTTSSCPPVVNCLFAFASEGTGQPMLLAGTEGAGIWYLYASFDNTSHFWDWTNQTWQRVAATAGTKVRNFTRENSFSPSSSFRVRAATDGGAYSSSNGVTWNLTGGGMFTDITNGQNKIGFANKGLPDPDAPGSSTIWGTVSMTGVQRGTETAGISSALPSPSAIIWENRNGSGAGQLTGVEKANVQSIIQLSDSPTYTVLMGTTNSGVSRTEDEGVDFWYASNDGFLTGASLDIRDFLESANGDVLCAMHGPSSNGGVYISSDRGKHWVSISSGFILGQTLSSIICNDENPPTYYAGAYSAGSYATTISPQPNPTIATISVSTGPSTGGTTGVVITGTNFQCACPDNYTCATGCDQAKATFGGFDATTTSCTSTSLTVTTPQHPQGKVDVSVRNPDTRVPTVPLSQAFTFTDGSNVLITLSRNGSNQVVVAWTGGGSPTKIYRSPKPDFSQALTSKTLGSSPYTFTDTSGTDSHIYYYSVE